MWVFFKYHKISKNENPLFLPVNLICVIIDKSKLMPPASRLFGGGVRAHFPNSSSQYGLLRVWFALRKIWFMSWDHWRLSVRVIPKSMVSLAVVYCRVPSTCMWYYLFDSDFLLAMFRVLYFGKPRLIVKVWPQLESWVVLLKRDLISILRNSSCIIWSRQQKLLF